MGYKKLTAKVKAQCIKDVLENNMKVKEVAKKYKIGHSTVGAFITKYRKDGNKIMMDKNESSTNNESSSITPNQADLQIYKNKIKLLEKEKQILKQTIAILMKED